MPPACRPNDGESTLLARNLTSVIPVELMTFTAE